MALITTDTHGGNSQRMRRAVVRGKRMLALAVFVGEKEGLWHS